MNPIEYQQLHQQLLSYPHTFLDYPFGPKPAVYKVKLGDDQTKMFALLVEQASPLRLSLKCDPLLAETLRERYESILPGYHLNKRHWNTIILSGQVNWEELIDLISHSYQLVGGVER